MKAEDPTWGAPRIHGELVQLGFEVSEPTGSRYLRRLRRHTHPEKGKRWLAFLNNHREVIAGLDFFTVPTLNFGVLYCFFVIEHGRRRILHFNTTAHPTSEWIIQQLREAVAARCWITSFRSMNGTCERLCREYINYYHYDRTHKSLYKQTPAYRPIDSRPNWNSEVVKLSRIGGLHHRIYDQRRLEQLRLRVLTT